nr:MAG TPA: hypothetical protein [Caudoviricetes sp.]
MHLLVNGLVFIQMKMHQARKDVSLLQRVI